MALIVEDGTGLATAEAWISVADAATYLTSIGETWTVTVSEQEEDLRVGTQELENLYACRWPGTRATDVQALSWPRIGATDCDGYAVESDSVPVLLQRASALIAAARRQLIVAGDPFQPTTLSAGGTVVKSTVKLGPITESLEYGSGGLSADEAGVAVRRFPRVEAMLRPILLPAGRVEMA